MIVLSHDDVMDLLAMPDCIEVVAEALKGLAREQYLQPLRQRFRHDDIPSRLVLLPAARLSAPRLWGLKEFVVPPSNGARGLDSHQGAVLLHDGDDGRLLALVHAGAITAIRTAAVSAVGTRALARIDSHKVLIVGTGVQAKAHVEAMRCALPNARIMIWGRSTEKAAALASRLHTDCVSSLERGVYTADVVCTVTNSPQPLIKREWVNAGTHINAVGSSLPTTRELDGATLAAGTLFVDRAESTRNESGDFLLALSEGAIGEDHIRAELGEVLSGTRAGRTSLAEITIFKSLGFGTLDLAAAAHVYRQALDRKRGQQVKW